MGRSGCKHTGGQCLRCQDFFKMNRSTLNWCLSVSCGPGCLFSRGAVAQHWQDNRANGLQVFAFKSGKLTLAKLVFVTVNITWIFLTLAIFPSLMLFVSTCAVVVVFPSLLLIFWVSRPEQITVICVRRSCLTCNNFPDRTGQTLIKIWQL